MNLKTQSENDEDSDLDSDYQLPHFSDSESEDVVEASRTCSPGYTTDSEVDLEWELYKILHAPDGPVPLDQIYLTFTCQITDLYVKAVVDQNHSEIHILTYEKDDFDASRWTWTPTKCSTCIQKVRRILADGGCTVPFAMDMESSEDVQLDSDEESESDDEDVISVIEMPMRQTFAY